MYLRKLYCNWANNSWRWPQTVVGASSELRTVVEGSNGTSWLFDDWLGVTATDEGSSSSSLSLLLWLLSLGESFVFVTLCDVGKPFKAKDLKKQKSRRILHSVCTTTTSGQYSSVRPLHLVSNNNNNNNFIYPGWKNWSVTQQRLIDWY